MLTAAETGRLGLGRKACLECRRAFRPRSPRQRLCSNACRAARRTRRRAPQQWVAPKTDDKTALEYISEINRLTRRFESLKAQLVSATSEAARKQLQREIYTVKVGRGQLRQTLEYMLSFERRVTRAQRLSHEAGDTGFIGLDGKRFWIDRGR